MSDFLLNWIATTPVYASPYLLACLGLIINERAGVLNLGVEGMMAVGALAGVMASYHLGNPWLGVALAIIAGAALALIFGISTIGFRTDQVLTGLILVGMGIGISGVVGRHYAHQPIVGFDRLYLGWLTELPVMGRIFFKQDPLVYVTAALVIAVWWGVYRSLIGLRLRAIGEDPSAGDTAGLNVEMYRLSAVVLGGGLCGLSGAYLSLAAGRIWVEGMIAGRGWIAYALLIFAGRRPFLAVIGALIFGGTEALIPRVQALGADVPVYMMMMLPYLITLVVMIIPAVFEFGESSAAPGSLGINYLRQERQ